MIETSKNSPVLTKYTQNIIKNPRPAAFESFLILISDHANMQNSCLQESRYTGDSAATTFLYFH